MKLIITEKDKRNVNGFLEWLVLMFGYALVLVAVAYVFKSMTIS